MQSEGGAAGALHGALQAGALGTTFTSSQGLLLMIPNMYKIAGELTPHGDSRRRARRGGAGAVDLRRSPGCDGGAPDRLCAAVVELGAGSDGPGADRARCDAGSRAFRSCISSTASAPRTKFRKIEQLSLDDMRAMIDDDLVRAHRARALSPDHPVLRGSAQNPDVYFQGREDGESLLPRLSRRSCRT